MQEIKSYILWLFKLKIKRNTLSLICSVIELEKLILNDNR